MARKQGSHGFVFEDIAGDTLRMRIKKAVFKQQHERASTRNVQGLPDEFSGLSEAIFVTDPEGRLVFMNGTAEAMTGTREEECRTLSLDQLINVRLRPEDATREEIVKQCVVKGNSVTSAAQSYSLSLTSGKQIHGEFSLSPMKDSVSKIVGFLLLVKTGGEDEVVEAIARAKQEWERGMDSVPALVALVNRRKKMIRLNRAMAQALGSEPRDVVGHSCCPLFGGVQNHTCLHDKTMRDGEVRSEEVISPNLGATYLVTVAPYRDSSGKPIGTVHIATNIAETKKLQDDLQSSRDSLLSKCEELEAALHNQRQQLGEFRDRNQSLFGSLVTHMEAVRLLLLSSDRTRHDSEKNLVKKLEISVKPLIMQLRAHQLSETSQALVKALEFHVSQICNQPHSDPDKTRDNLTFRENQICDMILAGLSSKEIAAVLGVSDHTIRCQRVHIRKKLELNSGTLTLGEYLRSAKIVSDEMA